MKLRFQTHLTMAVRSAAVNHNGNEYGVLGLPEKSIQAYQQFHFPEIDDKTIWVDIDIDPFYYPAWLLWAEHARLCGLISHMQIMQESEEGEH